MPLNEKAQRVRARPALAVHTCTTNAAMPSETWARNAINRWATYCSPWLTQSLGLLAFARPAGALAFEQRLERKLRLGPCTGLLPLLQGQFCIACPVVVPTPMAWQTKPRHKRAHWAALGMRARPLTGSGASEESSVQARATCPAMSVQALGLGVEVDQDPARLCAVRAGDGRVFVVPDCPGTPAPCGTCGDGPAIGTSKLGLWRMGPRC